MIVDGFTAEQIISLVLLNKILVDYLEALDYDVLDWLEWGNIHRN